MQLLQAVMANLVSKETKPILFTICLTNKEIDDQIAQLRRRTLAKICAKERDNSTKTETEPEERPMKLNTLELPPIGNGDTTSLASCPTPVAMHWCQEINDGMASRQRDKKVSFVFHPAKEIPKKSIREVKQSPLGSIIKTGNKEKQDKTNNFLCFGVHMKSRGDTNPGEKQIPQVINGSTALPRSNSAPGFACVQTGPVFRPWATGRKGKPVYNMFDPSWLFD